MIASILKRHSRRRAPNLGALELQVMELLWESGHGSAHSVRERLSAVGTDSSLSTVQSTLERLARKEVLSRRKDGRAYTYAPALSRESLIGLLIGEVASEVGGGALQPVLSGFVNFIDDQDPASLRELEDILRSRRERLEQGD